MYIYVASITIYEVVYTDDSIKTCIINNSYTLGVGKIPYLYQEMGSGTMNIMEILKKSLDPKNILNPGKILYHENIYSDSNTSDSNSNNNNIKTKISTLHVNNIPGCLSNDSKEIISSPTK